MESIVLPTEESIARAAELLARGSLVGLPTETVYGLAADATGDRAVRALYAAKGRPAANPLIVHVATIEAARALGRFNATAETLARAFWPGPLTLVLPRTDGCPVVSRASAGLATIALRIPAHPVALAVLRAFSRPVVAPSANPSGAVSPTTAEHVVAGLGDRVALVIDGDACEIGIESTVVALIGRSAQVLRPGSIAREALEALIGPVQTLGHPADLDAPVVSPGLIGRHYAPRAPLRLNAESVAPDEALLAFGPQPPVGAAATRNLSPTADIVEAARNLFAMLRVLDTPNCRGIAVMAIPSEGIGAAINDRLRRAAARDGSAAGA